MSIPNEEQRELAIRLRGMGINLIIGSHPHVKQGHEWINDTLIHYSLGNFVFHLHSTVIQVSLNYVLCHFLIYLLLYLTISGMKAGFRWTCRNILYA